MAYSIVDSGRGDRQWNQPRIAPLESIGDNPRQCQQSHSLPCVYIPHGETPTVSHQHGIAPEELYFYWVAFVDLFYWGLSQQQQQQPRDMSDERLLNQPINPNDVLTPFEVFYPHDTRAFTAYDLPNVSTILSFIPLQGEQRAPSTPLVKFVQKCMPFCCQRRGLVAHTVDFIKSTPAFFDLFGPVIWCMLANTYPTELAGTDRNTLFDMDRLMRVKHITDSRQSLVYALGRLHLMPSAKSLQKAFHRENDRGCWIVLSAVRLWVNMMIRKDEHYLSVARQCMEWDAITKESIAYAMKIRTTDLYKVLNDPFKPARTVLSDGKKNQKQFVNRYRVTTAISTISKCLMSQFEKTLIRETVNWKLDRQKLRKVIATTRRRHSDNDGLSIRMAMGATLLGSLFSDFRIDIDRCIARAMQQFDLMIDKLDTPLDPATKAL